MNRRNFLIRSMAATAAVPLSAVSSPFLTGVDASAGVPKVAVLLIDTDRVTVPINRLIYGQFL
ncbi:MAG: hypothetical protein WCA37_02370, partial [Terracidiphilus sp.]